MENLADSPQKQPSIVQKVVRRQTAALARVFGSEVPRQPSAIRRSRYARNGMPYRFVIMTYVVPAGEERGAGVYSALHVVTFLRHIKGNRWAPINGYVRHRPLEEVRREAYKRLDRIPAPEQLDADINAIDDEPEEVVA